MAVINSNRFNLQEVVDQALANYLFDDVVPALEASLDEVSKEAVSRLKKASPGKGKYKKGWSRKRDKSRIKVGYTIYNKVSGLPHLLEYSHALRNGGRSQPIVHIAPVEEWAREEAVDRFFDKLEGV